MDATYLKVRQAGRIISVAITIAIGVNGDGGRDVLVYMSFPPQHRIKLHLTNPLERLNFGIKRRTGVVGIFPDEEAVTRLVGAFLLEQNDEWAVQRTRALMLESAARLGDDPAVSLPAMAA